MSVQDKDGGGTKSYSDRNWLLFRATCFKLQKYRLQNNPPR